MRAPILKAVAAPPKLFWAPFLPALMNFGLNLPMMFMIMGVWKVNPLIFVIPMALGHIALIIYGSKDPHLSTMVQSYGPVAKPKINMYKSKGTKLAP
jgi:hypothetical protein